MLLRWWERGAWAPYIVWFRVLGLRAVYRVMTCRGGGAGWRAGPAKAKAAAAMMCNEAPTLAHAAQPLLLRLPLHTWSVGNGGMRPLFAMLGRAALKDRCYAS